MNEYSNKKKSFIYNGEILFYIINDIKPTEHKGKEWANAFMLVFDINGNAKDSFAIYDEITKVQYGMPNDAKIWYEKHKKDSL